MTQDQKRKAENEAFWKRNDAMVALTNFILKGSDGFVSIVDKAIELGLDKETAIYSYICANPWVSHRATIQIGKRTFGFNKDNRNKILVWWESEVFEADQDHIEKACILMDATSLKIIWNPFPISAERLAVAITVALNAILTPLVATY